MNSVFKESTKGRVLNGYPVYSEKKVLKKYKIKVIR